MSINDKARDFRDFCTFMLGTEETKPLVMLETTKDGDTKMSAVNGATISALIEAFRICYADPKPAPPARSLGTNDPLGLLPPREQ